VEAVCIDTPQVDVFVPARGKFVMLDQVFAPMYNHRAAEWAKEAQIRMHSLGAVERALRPILSTIFSAMPFALCSCTLECLTVMSVYFASTVRNSCKSYSPALSHIRTLGLCAGSKRAMSLSSIAGKMEAHISWVGTRGSGRSWRSYDVRVLAYLTLPVIGLQTLDNAAHTRVGEYRKLARADAVVETQVRMLLGCHVTHVAHRARLVHSPRAANRRLMCVSM
jgi:hypothetical protein